MTTSNVDPVERQAWVAFDYLYRDAGNFKAWGSVLLRGRLSHSRRNKIIARMDSGELFVAEQIGIPALYASLWELSGGPTEEDHGWHSFDGFRDLENPEGRVWGTANELYARFLNVEEWDVRLSLNCCA